ncbi:flavin-containing monooxygenase [Mycolicibacterium monacense]|uniref:Cyclohexanone monooxygenase n=3 Tax=Mycobacteriaceae TaxID=1762 RepID=A0AAD1N1E8_MYCMB|nr:NAD(P)/FAD-dependent oxidoreductase [Mycolicibacterium monacense]MDA4100058.1 cyclohexanone monooxygenase [Mycolicibacterium monacense DSM 44395]ORB20254.1 cyclohexanone monooxygenase [Mycolicibacterium monacense DSM 44395]QHP84361.1 NAD(P)/FAD-dependent oxidoreductase [Mycolicibacterium monacense DSM 44395]BBZ62886.1 cyclohexanone monooxygenase [Mycolicibacterium monacense]
MSAQQDSPDRFDVVIVGAGFAGLYMLHRVRALGLTARIVERGEDVGGTWYWNRYPGARCDIESIDYAYSFDETLTREWRWTERYAAQPEILSYIGHVADRFDLRDDITFGTTVRRADWDDDTAQWTLVCDTGQVLRATFCVMATGCLSVAKQPEFPGLSQFRGRWYHTGRWPHDPVDFTGRRVAVIGTGSSGIQAIPRIAEAAEQLFVLQRTPNYSMPAQNRPLAADEFDSAIADFATRRRICQRSDAGVPHPPPTQGTFDVTAEERERRYEEGWQRGGINALSAAFTDFFTDEDANRMAQEFARNKIRSIVEDAQTAELLCPQHHIGTKRTCVDTGYFQTYNRDNVELVNSRAEPIDQITATGIRLVGGRHLDVDTLVFAIGFDAITGALTDIDIRGTGGAALRDEWDDGPRTLLGLQTAGFPNLFMVTGPGSPSVLSNMLVSIEQHVDWIADCLLHLRKLGHDRIEATRDAQDRWMEHIGELAAETLYPQANSWYLGANIPGKARTFMPYVAGCGEYRRECDEVVASGYSGFLLGRPSPVREGTSA